jgi:hypothetical protein
MYCKRAVHMRRSGNMMLSQVINNYLCCAVKVISSRGYIRRKLCTDFNPGWLLFIRYWMVNATN